MKLTHYCLLLGILTPLLVAPVRARAFDDQEDDDLGRKLAEMQLIRTADMVADPLSLVPFPWGDDALGQGSIEVRARRLLAVHLQGVPPASTFSVQFCGALNLPARCQELGQIQSNTDGNANAAVPFPSAGNPWTGFFTLVRDGKTMYVSGFAFPPMPPMGGAAVNVEGRVAAMNLNAMTFTVEGFAPLVRVNSDTRFTSNLKLGDLKVGSQVEVEGSTQADGSVLATRVKARREKN